MPIYKLNGETYDIPNDVVADFEKDNPDATVTYFANGDEYEIPVNERNGFLAEFPDATTENTTRGPGSTKQPMIDAMRQQSEPQNAPAAAQPAAPESKPAGYQPTSQELAGFQQTIDNAGFAAGSAAGSFSKKASNLQKRQGLTVPNRVNVGETNNLVEGEKKLNPETGKLEQTYITSQGNSYTNKDQAEGEQRLIDDYDRRMRYATGQAMDELSSKYISPLVDEALKKADEEWDRSIRESSGVPVGEGMEMFALRRANEKADPDKILQGLQKTLEEAYKSPEMQKEISRLAESIGVSKDEYLEQVVAPSLAARLENAFASSQISKNMPKNATEYIIQGLSNSIGGMLMSAATETKGQRFYKNQAEAMTEKGENPYYNPGTAASLAKMGVSFAADAPFFGLYGRVSGQVAKTIAERQISKMVAEGLSETAARSIVGTALENSVGARMKNYIMQHVVGGALTMGAYNATSETARQIRDKEGLDLGQIAESTAEGLAVGSAFGLTGGAVQALSQPLSGISKIGAKVAGFGAEAETMYATEELSKMAHGQEGFENPFEGSVEALMKLGVMKATGPDGLKKIAGEILHPIKSNQQQRTGIRFTDEEQAYVRNTQEGQKLIDALSQMHPGRAISEVNGKKRLTEEGEALRLQLSQNYEDFMNNKDIPASVKQKVAGVLGGVYRPGLETGADIIQNEDGSVLVKTRDKDGNCIQDLSFDNLAEAEQWRENHLSECRRNDAVNMWNNTTDQTRQEIVDIVRDQISGESQAAEMLERANGMSQKRMKRELDKLNKFIEAHEGRELTDEEARNFIQMVIRDGDDATFSEIYQLIHDKAYPKDMPDTKRNYWEGQQLTSLEKHFAQADAQVAEEQLMLLGEDFANEVMDNAQYPDEKIAELASRLVQGKITKDQFNAAVDYYNKISKVNGMFDETLKDIDNQVEAANAYVRKNTHADSGSLIDAVYGQKPDRQYYVTAGHFEVTPDGKLNPTDNSGMVILRDKETGEIIVANPSDITVSHIDDPNRVIAENDSMEGLRGQLMKQADDTIDLHPDTPAEPAEDGEVFMGADGKQYMTLRMQDEAGNTQWIKIEIGENGIPLPNTEQPLDIDEYHKAKSNEIDAASRPQEEPVVQDVEETSFGEDAPEVGSASVAASQHDNIDVSDGEGGGTDVPPSRTDEPASRIPVDEKGRKLYEQAKPEDTLAELTEKYGEEKAQQMISKIAESTAWELEKLQQTDTSGITDMNDLDAHETQIADLQKKLDFWNGLIKKPETTVEAEQLKPTDFEKKNSALDNTTDTGKTSNIGKRNDTATPQSTVSGSKDTNNSANLQENQQKNDIQQPVADQKKLKIYQNTVNNNIGNSFTFTYDNGTRSVLKVQRIDHDGNAVLMRQDYDAQGNPIGEAREERYNFATVGEAIVSQKWKKELSTYEKLQKYKYNQFKVGDVSFIDVLTEDELQQILNAYERGDKQAVGNLTGEFRDRHQKDFILRGRDQRNEKIEKAFARSGRGERLRGIRSLYKGIPEASVYLEDQSMEPQTIEEYVADALGDVPKMGNGFLAYTSYDKGGNTIVGLKDETGFGSRGFGGDTKGFNNWLAPNGEGISLKQFAEQVHETLPDGLKQQYSDQDLRNIILDVLASAEKPSDIANYILRNRQEQAEAEARNFEDRLIDEPSYQKVMESNSFANRLKQAKEIVNTEPTEGQKEAGNYKKGHVSFGGYDFTIENPEGSMRRGKDASGKAWEQKMNNTYGYILGRFGKDGDHLDMFINDAADLDNWNGTVYVVDQVDPKTGKFDEHKVLYGFDSLADAKKAYLSNYEKGWKGLGRITGVTKEGFDMWLDSSKRKLKQFADHSIAKEHMVESEHASFDPAMKQLNTRGITINDPELMKEYGLKDIVLSKTGDHVTLNKIVVENQGEGNGTRFMEDLARLADEKGWTLALTPSGGFGAKSVKRLRDFYKRFGFADNKGRNADFYTRESMIRRPKETVGANTPERQEQALRDAVVEHLRSKGIEVSTDWKLGQKILDDYNSRTANREDAEGYDVKPQKVTDQQTLNELNKGKTVKRYRAMQLIDGKLYPPMSAKVDGEMRQPTEIGVWEQSEERPDLIKNGKFVLNKGQKGQGSVPAAYNPYFHTSTSGLNDQFTSAYKRPELVVVEVEIPESELTSGYKAEGAKDAVGNVDWHSGVVNGQLPADRQRQVTLSRYNKVNRVVPDSEVADMIAKQLEGTNVEVPYNVVTPQLRKELEARGVKISDKPAGSVTEDINGNPIEKGARYFKTGDGYAYGYTLGGKIYVDPRIATSETPIHEYGHLYCAMKRQTDPEGWKEWKKVMFGDKLVQPIIDKVKRDYPELEGKEDDFAEEIITQFSGKRGSERLREIAEEVAKEKGGIFGKAEAVTAMQRLKSILNRFWEGVARMMGWKYTNANQIADRIMADMLNGVDPTKVAKETRRLRPQAEPPRSQKVDYTSKEEIEKTKTIFDAAKNFFGTTRDVREAGYILPDGTMPDFSGRHLMDPGSDTSFLRGRRSTDHREVQSLAYEKDGNTETGIETDMPDFIRRGAIRIDDNAGAINLATKPTAKQKSVLRQIIARNDGYVQVDFGDGWDSDHYVEYDGAKPSKVLADIDRYFDEGIKPDGGPKFQMVGRSGAAEADRAERKGDRSWNLKLAEEAEKAGKDAHAIKFATGWERGADGEWRYEIPDADVDILSKYKAKVDEMKKKGVEKPQPIIKLGDLLGEDNELFKYYPELKKTDVLFSNMLPDGVAGKFDGENIELNAKETSRFDVDELNNESIYGTLLHEVQHAIQEIEGFAKGGSLLTSTTEEGINAIIEKKERQRAEMKEKIDANNKILNDPENLKMSAELDGKTGKKVQEELTKTLEWQAAEYDNLGLQIERLRKTKSPSMTDARDLYQRLAGEVEARNVTERMGMTEEQRRQSLASETEDVYRKDQVIIMGDGTSMNINDIKPVGTGDFGEIYDQFKGKPKEAIDFLTKKRGGDVLGVFNRKEVGDIDLVWGYSPNPYKGKGLSHIIKKHIETLHDFKDIEELTSVLDDVVNNGEMGDDYAIEKDGYRVVIAKEKDGKRWILTAFDNNKKIKEKASITSLNTPSDVKGEGAVSPDASLSGDKDTKNTNTLQENEQKSSAEAPKFQKVEDDTHSDNFKNFFGDWEKDPENSSKIVDGRGEPMVVYHQTANDFTVFDPRHKGSGTNDYQLPFGIFMKPTARNIGLGGEKQMPLYANIRKPLRVENRQVLSALLKSKVEGYKEALAEYDRIDKEYAKKFDEAEKFDHERNVENWNKWKSGEMTEQEYQDAISDTAENVINQWKEAQNKPISEMKELIDSYFRNSEYDGIWIVKDEGSMGRSTETIIAFEPNQVKSATDNIGTYDPNNPDIRFQRVGNPEPDMTPEDRQYWNKWDAAMKKWKERNAIPADQTQAPEKPRYQQGESALDYAQKLVQWNRMKSLWQTAPKLEDYRQVRDDKDIVEAARENEQRYPDSPSAKMRRVASDMMRIRHAMSRQKAYDKATVKAVTDFAHEFMKLGFGDNLSRGEIERMLSSVKNATGAKDIKNSVDNIMNILIDNHLRNLDQRVQKLSSTKELSKTAQGVEKQGRLELKGQRMIQAFRDAREKRMTLEQINERMADVAEKMNRSDDEAPMWEQEYEGLVIARQYVENIEGSRQEWADLDTLYKDAVKGYKTSGRSYKDQQEYLESIEQAMQENKIERIGYFGDIIGRLEGNIAESMKGAKEFVEREKQRQKHIWDMANFDLAGKDMGAMREKGKGKPANFFLQPLGTFEQMLKQFGSRNANGEGYLYDYFMRNWMDATDKAFVNEQKAKEDLDAKAREVFGGKVKRWSDLYDISRSLPTLDVEVLDGEEPKTFKLTQGNLLYIYMADKMIDGRMKLRKMGIDEEKVEKIKDFLDPRLVQLGDWLQNEYLPQKRTEYNKVHERMFGAPMAAIDNYFPLKVLGDARYQEQDVNVPDSETLPSTITGNIIKRRKNALPLDILHTDALSLAIEHVEDMERWAAQAEWNKDINTLLSYTTFRNKVKNMDTIYGSGDALWNSFKDAAKMAAGTYNPSAKSGHVDAAISNIAKGVTAAKINFRVYTAFKQLLSAPAFLHDVNLADFVHDAVNPYGSWKWAMENMPVFRKRWKSRQVGDTRLMDDPTDWKLWKNNVVQMATRIGMSPNALVDGVTCAVGARSIYKSRYKKYKDIGASDEVAHKRALQDAEIGYNLTQQSSEGAFVSAIQKDRTVAANMLSVFRNSSMAYTRQWVDAARNLRKRAQKGYKEDSIKFMTRQMQDQFGIDEDQAKRAAELEYAREGRRDVARMLNMMFGVTVAWNLGASLPYLLLGDDDNTKKEMLSDALMKGLLAGPTEGLAAGNIYSDFIGRTLANEQTRNTFKEEGIGAALDNALKQGGDYEVNPLPLMADIQGMIKKMGYDKYAAAQDVFNIVTQSAVGVNPQTFTDMWNAAMDYGAPGWDGRSYYPDDENLTRPKELALFMMRLMNAPTSSWRNKYIDELGMNAEDAQKLPYREMARRYAHYKHWKDAPIMGWLRGDEARAEKIDKMQGQFDKAVEERMNRLTNLELANNLSRSMDPEEKRKYAKIAAKRMGVTPGPDSQKPDDEHWYQELYQERMTLEDINEDELLIAKKKDLRDDNAKKEVNMRLDWIRDGKYDSKTGRKGKHKDSKDDPKLLLPGKKQFETNGNEQQNKEIMKNIRQWRREALEILMRAEAQ